jgi:hypothetical protein
VASTPTAGGVVAPPAGRRFPTIAVAGVAGLVLILVAGAGAFALLPRQSATASPTPAASVPVVAVASPSSVSAAPVSPSPSIAASVPPSAAPSPTLAPTPTPTPAGRQARILSITLSGSTYVVDYQVFGYQQQLTKPGAPAPQGRHVHFFWNTLPPSQAGMPQAHPKWYVYYGPIPFTRWKVSDRPAKATQLCILVANSDHTVVQGTGNCVDLPG